MLSVSFSFKLKPKLSGKGLLTTCRERYQNGCRGRFPAFSHLYSTSFSLNFIESRGDKGSFPSLVLGLDKYSCG